MFKKPGDSRKFSIRSGYTRRLHHGKRLGCEDSRAVGGGAVAHMKARIAQLVAHGRANAASRVRTARERPWPSHARTWLPWLERVFMPHCKAICHDIGGEEERAIH